MLKSGSTTSFLLQDMIIVACSCSLVGTIIVRMDASKFGLSAEEDAFYNKIIILVALVPDEETLLTGGDFNGHVVEHNASFEGVHGGNDYDVIDHDEQDAHC